MRKHVRIAGLTVALAACLGLAACGSDTKTVTTNDGKTTVSGNGKNTKVTINGEGNTKITFGEHTVPNGFPSEVPLPKGLTLATAASGERAAKKYFSLGYQLGSKSPATALTAYKRQLDDAGFNVVNAGNFGGSTGSINSLQAQGKGWTLIASAFGAGGQSVLSLTVTSGS